VIRFRVIMQCFFEREDFGNLNFIEVTLVNRVKGQRHIGDRQRRVLLLLHELGNALAAFQLVPGSRIEIGRKLCERRKLTILSERETNTTAELLDDLGLRRTAYTRYRQTSVDRRADTCVEEVGLEEDLSIGNRDYVGRYEGGYVTALCLNDRQSSQRTRLALDLAAGYVLDVIGIDGR